MQRSIGKTQTVQLNHPYLKVLFEGILLFWYRPEGILLLCNQSVSSLYNLPLGTGCPCVKYNMSMLCVFPMVRILKRVRPGLKLDQV